MKTLYKAFVGAMFALLLLGAQACATDPVPDPVSGENGSNASVAPRAGSIAPNFLLYDGTENYARLSDLRGKVVFINFWATWCPYCVYEMPAMERMYQEYKGRGFEILAVDVGGAGETVAKMQAFMRERSLTFPALDDMTGRVKRMYKVDSLPTTFIVDRQGTIRYIIIGWRPWDLPEHRLLISSLLDEPEGSSPAPSSQEVEGSK